MRDEYYESKRISNSSLSWFQKSPKFFKRMLDKEIKQEDKSYFKYGKLVHKYISEPDTFDEEYLVMSYDIPTSPQQKQFCIDYAETGDLIESYKNNYKSKKKDKELIELATNLATKYENYIKSLKNDGDKVIISEEKLEFLKEIKTSVSNHIKANELLLEKPGLTELPIYWNYKDESNDVHNLECKSKIDKVIIDKENKSITLIDLKTTYQIHNFKESFDEYSYDRQLAFYWLAIASYFETEFLGEDIDEYSKHTYIVAINSTPKYPEVRVFNIPVGYLNSGLAQIQHIMPDLHWHYENDKWDHTKQYYFNDGVDRL